MDEMTSKLEYLAEKRPEKLVDLAKKMHRQHPEAVEGLLETVEDGGHITNRHKYDELVNRLEWKNKQGHGERWKLEELESISRIDFKNANYTKYDFAFLVNMLYAKCCKEMTDRTYFIKLAKCLLEDDDEDMKVYKGVEHEKHKYKKRGTESHYEDEPNEYEEESRRGRRRYRSERMEENRYEDYRNEDYRNEYRRHSEYDRYRNEYDNYDSRYRDSKIGFR